MGAAAAAGGAPIAIRADLCKGCDLCALDCPEQCLALSPRRNAAGYRYMEYLGAGCTGCGACYYVCPEPCAMTVRRPERAPKRAAAPP